MTGLRVVPLGVAPPLDMAGDIYQKARAEIAAVDWARVHIAADRRSPLDLQESRPRRTWSR